MSFEAGHVPPSSAAPDGAQPLPPQAGAERKSAVCPRLRGKWLRSVAAADDGGMCSIWPLGLAL